MLEGTQADTKRLFRQANTFRSILIKLSRTEQLFIIPMIFGVTSLTVCATICVNDQESVNSHTFY